jgi:hypothetical protein
MPITFGIKGSSCICSQIIEGVENDVMQTFLAPAEEVLISLLKILCRNI